MAREENVEAVKAAILKQYGLAAQTGVEPTVEELIKASGVSSATYYRVLDDHTDAEAVLTGAVAGFAHSSGQRAEPDDDPIVTDPHAVVAELKTVIAELISAQRDRDATIRSLRHQLADLDHGSVDITGRTRGKKGTTDGSGVPTKRPAGAAATRRKRASRRDAGTATSVGGEVDTAVETLAGTNLKVTRLAKPKSAANRPGSA